jgi:transposase
MLTLPPSVRIFLAVGATDMRRGMDGLAALVRERLGLEPLSGHLFLFRNRRGDRIKILVWDRSGFWVLYKRLEKGTFSWLTVKQDEVIELKTSELMLLLSGAETFRMTRRKWFDFAEENLANPLARQAVSS